MKFFAAFGHLIDQRSSLNTEMAAYRLVGGQVLEVLEQLNTTTVASARAYIQTARCLELFADGLVTPYIGSHPTNAVPQWITTQAVSLYRPIPAFVTAAKQEAIDPGGRRDIALPWILQGRIVGASQERAAVFSTYAEAVKAVMDWVEVFLANADEVKAARLYFAEATTNYDSARHLASSLDDRDGSKSSKQAVDDYLWTALGYAIGAIQEACAPGIYHGMDIDTKLEGHQASEPHFEVIRPHPSHVNTPGWIDALEEIARAFDDHREDDYRRDHHHEHHHHDHDHHKHHHDWD
ncbi:MAG: hypothetical protein M1499_00585 [Firmicutes bacterium]|nr:hypothetical protein [Bacillota bacterium]MCL5971047.1 hypothetical protein [Bacillota bacterium]